MAITKYGFVDISEEWKGCWDKFEGDYGATSLGRLFFVNIKCLDYFQTDITCIHTYI